MWQTIFLEPLYNILVLFTDLFGGYLGISVIVVTVLIKLLLSPFVLRAVKATQLQAKIQPEIDRIKKEFTDTTVQAQKLMEVYKNHNAHPFSGCLPILIQLPIIIALYQVFLAGIGGHTEWLYDGVTLPKVLHEDFLGLSLSRKSAVLAVLAGVTQYFQIHFSTANRKPAVSSGEQTDQAKMLTSIQQSMKYTLPVMITVFGFALSGAVVLYWVVSNIVTIFQEMVIRKILAK